ncbi:hypothetical protein HZA55_04115 [Candidatus Poribacteria bacterium]|nr:hypothetical protein [Candidatus Poribacteria bacterium]
MPLKYSFYFIVIKILGIICILLISTLVYARVDVSLALNKKGDIYLLAHAPGVLYKINSDGKLIATTNSIQNNKRNISVEEIEFFGSDSYGNIYAFNRGMMEVLRLNDDFIVENNWFINFNVKSFPKITLGSNDKIFVYLPLSGFIEYSPQGQVITQFLEEPKCKEKDMDISIGARGKIAVYNRKKIFLWFTSNDTAKVFNVDMETGSCIEEKLGSYINFIMFDKKDRIIILAPSWINVVGFFHIEGNSKIYPKPLSPIAITIDNFNKYYIYNMDTNEILIIKDTGKIEKIISLDETIKIK